MVVANCWTSRSMFLLNQARKTREIRIVMYILFYIEREREKEIDMYKQNCKPSFSCSEYVPMMCLVKHVTLGSSSCATSVPGARCLIPNYEALNCRTIIAQST